ncbi:damX protein [Candidatus Photodesmus blepharus]|uniref:DamX protein n=1 Tax=Candidatus Photodesmus blepharonis TaxID=1179155 RepID=A0A084CMM0_9GAMM|nr:AAA family ATPase [Candidatus Photodesmus blepharus]KEY91049.1 damX protein [Candidatus Photodesmus blepharus]
MSLMYRSFLLELKSQTELLKRLQLLASFSSNLVAVLGESGSGKSWLAPRYLEAWVEDKNQSLLVCHPNQEDEERRSIVLNQIVLNPLFNPKESLLDSLNRILHDNVCDVVIVVDDAHLLSDFFIAELWMLVLEAQKNPHWTINVVLFARLNSIEGLLTRLSYGQAHKPIELEIDALSQNEADHFFELLVLRFIENDMEKHICDAYKKVKKLPGEIIALGELKVKEEVISGSIFTPSTKILTLAIFFLIMGSSFWWSYIPIVFNEKVERIIDSFRQTAIFSLKSSLGQFSRSDHIARININDVLLDSSNQSDVSFSSDFNRGIAVVLDDKSSIVDFPEIELVIPPERMVTFFEVHEELKTFPPHSYTLQLAAMHSFSEVQRFIEQYNLQDRVRVYLTFRNGLDWYIITYENYSTIQTARASIEKLSKALKELGPWAKSMKLVHQEIDSAEWR